MVLCGYVMLLYVMLLMNGIVMLLMNDNHYFQAIRHLVKGLAKSRLLQSSKQVTWPQIKNAATSLCKGPVNLIGNDNSH